MNRKAHPFAINFPSMSPIEIQALADDILENGLREPILLTNDGLTIVDGRNRLRACGVAGVEPRFRLLPMSINKAEILRLMISENIRTRDLTPGQLAMIGYSLSLELEKFPVEELVNYPPIRSYDNQSPRSSAAAVLGVSSKTVWQARMIVSYRPELHDKVLSGEMRLNTAYEQVMEGRGLRSQTKKIKPTNLSIRPPRGRDSTRKGIADRRAWLRHLAEDNLTAAEIAQRLDISEEHVRKLARRNNVELPGDAWSYKRRKHNFNVNRVAQVVADDLASMEDSLSKIREHLDQLDSDRAVEWARIYWRTAKRLSNLAKVMHFDSSAKRENDDST